MNKISINVNETSIVKKQFNQTIRIFDTKIARLVFLLYYLIYVTYNPFDLFVERVSVVKITYED